MKGSADNLPGLIHKNNNGNYPPQHDSQHTSNTIKIKPITYHGLTIESAIDYLNNKPDVSFAHFSILLENNIISQIKSSTTSNKILINTYKEYKIFKQAYVTNKRKNNIIPDAVGNIFSAILILNPHPTRIKHLLNDAVFRAKDKDLDYATLLVNSIADSVKIYNLRPPHQLAIRNWVAYANNEIIKNPSQNSNPSTNTTYHINDLFTNKYFALEDLQSMLISLKVVDKETGLARQFKQGRGQGQKSAFIAAYRILTKYKLLADTTFNYQWSGAFQDAFIVTFSDKLIAYHIDGQKNQTSGAFKKSLSLAEEWVLNWQREKGLITP